MKNENKSIFVLLISVILMLIICLISIQFLKKAIPSYGIDKEIVTEISYITEVVYIPVYTDSDSIEVTEEETEMICNYFIKSYEGKIGIFNESNLLIKTLDVNIKTLPKTDQDLLKKGLCVNSKDELIKIIEDYTG